MKRLFLTSQGFQAIGHVGKRLGQECSLPMVVITTATEDRVHSWMQKSRDALDLAGFNYKEYSVTGKSVSQIEQDLAKYQMMYIIGGNPFYLLQEIQKSACADYLTKRVEEGMIYIGHSAGSVLAGPDLAPIARPENLELAPNLHGTKGLDLVNFVILPHFGGEKRRTLFLKQRLPQAYDLPYPYIPLTDNQYVEVVGDMNRIVDITKDNQ